MATQFRGVVDTLPIAAEHPSLFGMILHPANEDIAGFDVIRFFGDFEQFAHPAYDSDSLEWKSGERGTLAAVLGERLTDSNRSENQAAAVP